MAQETTGANRTMSMPGLDVNHYVAIIVGLSVVALLLIGKGITGFKVPLTNVKVSA